MPSNSPGTTKLETAIQQVANQYSCAMVLRGLVRVGQATAGLILLFSLLLSGLQGWEVSRGWLLLLFLACEGWAVWYWFYRPLREPVAPQRIALYIEENHPELENRIISAVEFRKGDNRGSSAWMIEQFFKESEQFTRRISFSDLLNTDTLVKRVLITAGFFIVSLGILSGFHRVWIPEFHWAQSAPETRVSAPDFTVEPGDARVRRGDQQVVLARPSQTGFPAAIRWRTGDAPWNAAAMEPSPSGGAFYHTFPNIQNDVEYQVQYGNRSSDVYRVTVWYPPRVESIDLTYTYPDYLGMEPKEVPNGGAISAVEGTRARISAWVNKPLVSAELVLNTGERLPMKAAAGKLWVTEFVLTENGSYSIHLTDRNGDASEYDPVYEIQAVPDAPPQVKIAFPRSDQGVTMLEEVPFELEVTDDHGLADYGLQYEVAGRDPVRISLLPEPENGASLTQARGRYDLMLEEMDVEPGDLVTWTVWAKDQKPGRDAFEELGDPYFLEILPFKHLYEEAISNQSGDQNQSGGGGGGGAGQDAASQKEILIATWNLRRNGKSLAEAEYQEKRGAIIEAQQQLRERTASGESMLEGSPSDRASLREAMDQAVKALESANLPEPAEALTEAAGHEQTAYRLILKMQPERSQVQEQLASAAQGGGQQQQDRPEINELELNRTRNFYEEERRPQEELAQADESLSHIKELTQRQRNIQEEISKLISEQPSADTEEEREELRRRLEKLIEEEQRNLERLDELQQDFSARPMNTPSQAEARPNLENVREQMNRGLENLEQSQLQEARSAGSRAISELNQVEKNLRQYSRDAAAQKLSELQERMAEITAREQTIREGLKKLKEELESPQTALDETLDGPKDDLLKQREELARDFKNLLDEAGRLAERSEQSQKLMSQKLGDWLRRTSQKEILEEIEKEKNLPLIHYGIWDSAIAQEEIIVQKINEAARELQEISDFLIGDDLEGLRQALKRLRRVMEESPPDEERAIALDTVANSTGALERNSNHPGPAAGVEGATGETSANTGQPRQESNASTPSDSQAGERGETNGEREGSASQGRDAESAQGPSQASSQLQQDGQQQGRQEGQSGETPGRPDDGNPPISRNVGGTGGEYDRRGYGGSGPGGGRIFRERFDFPRTPEALRRFMDEDAARWLETLRDAEPLLPENSPYRQEIAEIRETLEELRSDYRRSSRPPIYDLISRLVYNPLVETAAQISEEIERRLAQREFVLRGEGGVPARYQKQVAEYFKALSESEPAR
ncbi:MAG: hypothetical protein ACE15F_06125 [bacterium]